METLVQMAERLRLGATSARAELEKSLARIDDPDGEGSRAFLGVFRESAQATARAVDDLRQAGVPLPPLAGVPISVKDLFDVAGDTTRGGSRVLADRPPADRDAAVVSRLRSAGAVLVGRTNMTEFAYSGVGLNPHYGTPANPHDRKARRLPGGSTSGGAVSVSDGMALGAIGTDTGGSCRIPAALCGMVGYKPTQGRIPMDGCLPLSPSFDSIGALASTVDCVTLLDAVMAGESPMAPKKPSLRGLRLFAVENVLQEGMDDSTANAFDAALQRLSAEGAVITRGRLEALDRLPDLMYSGGIVAAEAFAWHEALLEQRGRDYDPRVLERIRMGGGQRAADYLRLLELRRALRRDVAGAVCGYDAVVAPTTPVVAPLISDLDADEDFTRINKLMLRNPSLANMLDRPSVSVPCQAPEQLPVGFMLMGHPERDRALLGIAAAVEAGVRQVTG